ncbi:TRAP transporter TatT component family protein [Polyangium sorediatum]|uniref:TRAP transporter TatT component family protein n=1 Tax=Polyangium sorediatum TaxID=889274 RepID=A0ABT6P282_9BACT|nr:TRAP transporter TatT component family protein [Polyangium sorediatum]MDI1434683.1 TRAP transporter TatT component family protein [Polyangium sorediatum]
MRPLQTLSVLALSALSLASTGCIKKMFLEGQIEATSTASAAIDTLTDYEIAKVVAFNGIGQFEGMHYLAPDNEDALFALVKTWTSATFAFIEDELEDAEDAEGLEGPRYLYLKNRAAAGYDRGLQYGIQLLEIYHPGFEAARKNDDAMRAYTAQFTDAERDTPALFWAGYAWISKTNILKDDAAAVGDLWIGVALMERAVALDPKFMYGNGHTILGAYHARTAMAELDDAKKHFDQALAIHGGKMLLTQVQYAGKYHCLKGDKDSYVKALTAVVEAGDVLPEQRLANVVAKRRAVRYLGKVRMRECGF